MSTSSIELELSEGNSPRRVATIISAKVKIFQKKVKLQGQIMVLCERSCHPSGLKIMAKVKNFKVGKTARSQGHKLWYHLKGLVRRNTHMKSRSLMV